MRDPKVLLRDKPGDKYLLLGNESISRGALEAGASVVTTYPGTPASEIGDTVAQIADDSGIYVEYSANEKVAMEVAAGASLSGARALTAMKMVGLNVASDVLVALGYTGVKGGLVVVSADDPDCFSSQDEQDNRYYAFLANIPYLEPSNPQEALKMTLSAFELSEEIQLPVILRMVTRVSHTRGIVTFGPIQRRKTGTFVREPKRLINVPDNARESHMILLEKMNRAQEISERSVHNKISGADEFGLVTSGVSYNYCVEALQLIGATARMLKIGMANPPPKKLILEFLRSIREVGIVEELEPILEDQVRIVAGELDRRVKVYGKKEEFFPRYGELSVRLVATGLAKILGRTLPFNYEEIARKTAETAKITPPRPPMLCPGCPHIASFHAIKAATSGKAIVATDIGCYTLGFQPPLSVGDVFLCMGASAGLAAGFSKFTNDPVLGVVGDSTFLHGSIPGLINAAYNNHKFVYVVLDNLTTAMTGHQPHPGTGVTATGKQSKRIMIENVAKACGIEYVKVVDPFEHQTAIQAIQEALRQRGPSVVVFRRPCVQIKAPVETVFKNKTELPATSAESDGDSAPTVNRFWSCGVV